MSNNTLYESTEDRALERIARHGNLLLSIAFICVLVGLIIPLPPGVLDILLTFNIALSVTILLVVIYSESSLDISVFPSLLLVTTLLRLALNVATTRRILLSADPGKVIEAFGNFVVGGNYIVGIVIFLILVIIQLTVITKGQGRIAEVAARFTLDAMPGKQMSIDADLNAGLITESEALKRREEIRKEADFYGAMDGASKYVRGDAMAGIIITFVNILGGFGVGVFQMGMPWSQALKTFTLLTIGDGLVAQIPSIIIATAAGILVSRAGASSISVGADLTRQLLRRPKAYSMVAGALFLFGIVPGLPAIPFFILSGVTWVIGSQVRTSFKQEEEKEIIEEEETVARPESKEEVLELLSVDPLEIEIGYGLISLMDTSQKGDFLERISLIRRQFALDLGLVIPPIRIRDNMQIPPDEYKIKIAGVEVSKGELMVDSLMAMDSGMAEGELDGIKTSEPSFGIPALWIGKEQKDKAESFGYTVVDCTSVLATHLSETIRKNANDLLTRQDVQRLVDNVKKTHSAVVDELIPAQLSLGGVQRVLQNLLRESVSILNMPKILEAISDNVAKTKETDLLSEYVRSALSKQLTKKFVDKEGVLKAVTLDPHIEEHLSDGVRQTEHGISMVIEPKYAMKLLQRISAVLEKAAAKGEQPVLLCSPNIRFPLKRFTEKGIPMLTILAYSEVDPAVRVSTTGIVEMPDELAMSAAGRQAVQHEQTSG